MLWKLSDVVSNPFQKFPLEEGRIEALTLAYGDDGKGYNENVLGRVRDGKLQIAYGHHRVEALRRLGVKEAEFIVQELSDADMLTKMITDNDPAYRRGMLDVIRYVHATVIAFAEGTFEKPIIDKHTSPAHLRYAPSFIAGLNNPPADGVPYTALHVARSLKMTASNGHGGWQANVLVTAALEALAMNETGYWTWRDIEGVIQLGPVLQEDGKTRAHIGADYILKAARDCRQRIVSGLLAAKENTAAATAAALEAQKQIDAIRKEEADKEAARSAEYARLPEIVEKANKLEAESRRKEKEYKEYREKRKKEDARVAAFRPEKMAVNRRVEAIKEEEAKKHKVTIQVGPRKEENENYWPELAELLKHFKQPLPTCAADVLKHRAALTQEQKKAVQIASAQAMDYIMRFRKQLN